VARVDSSTRFQRRARGAFDQQCSHGSPEGLGLTLDLPPDSLNLRSTVGPRPWSTECPFCLNSFVPACTPFTSKGDADGRFETVAICTPHCVYLTRSMRPDANHPNDLWVCLCSSSKEYSCRSILQDPLVHLSTTGCTSVILVPLTPQAAHPRPFWSAFFRSSRSLLAAAGELRGPPWLRQK